MNHAVPDKVKDLVMMMMMMMMMMIHNYVTYMYLYLHYITLYNITSLSPGALVLDHQLHPHRPLPRLHGSDDPRESTQ